VVLTRVWTLSRLYCREAHVSYVVSILYTSLQIYVVEKLWWYYLLNYNIKVSP
jgi:hypothetical protein